MFKNFSNIIKKTSLYNLQKQLNPVLGTFAGYEMPMTFKNYNIKDNCLDIRKDYLGVFDISHMGIIKLRCNNLELVKKMLERIFPINMEVLKPNKSALTILLDKKGYVQDDLIIGNLNDEEYRLVVNAGTKYDILTLLNQYNKDEIDIELENKSVLAIQGNQSSKILEDIFNINLSNVYFNDNLSVQENNEIEISRTGYTGEDGFELYCYDDDAYDLYQHLIYKSKECDEKILFAGLIERDILRMEAGLCLSGNEFGDNKEIYYKDLNMNFLIGKRRRLEGGFIGSEYINYHKYNRRGFYSKRPLKEGNLIFNNDEVVGFITSSTKSYNLNKFISMGYINNNINTNNLYTIVNNKSVEIDLISLPFIENRYYRKTE